MFVLFCACLINTIDIVVQVSAMILRITVTLLLIAQCSWSVPVDQLYSFGISEGDQELLSTSINAGPTQSVSFSNGFSFYNISRFLFRVSFTRKIVCKHSIHSMQA